MHYLSKSEYILDEFGYILEGPALQLKYIDKLSANVSKKVIKLSLPHNNISSLSNLEQFKSLCELDLSHNRIRNGR